MIFFVTYFLGAFNIIRHRIINTTRTIMAMRYTYTGGFMYGYAACWAFFSWTRSMALISHSARGYIFFSFKESSFCNLFVVISENISSSVRTLMSASRCLRAAFLSALRTARETCLRVMRKGFIRRRASLHSSSKESST